MLFSLTCLVAHFFFVQPTFYSFNLGKTVLMQGAQHPSRITSEGFILHDGDDADSKTLYYFQIRSDTSALVRMRKNTEAPHVALPRLVATTLNREIEEDFPFDSTRRNQLAIGYEDESVIFRLAPHTNYLLLGGLFLLSTGLLGLTIWMWRRFRREHERTLLSDAERRFLIKGREKERQRLAREIHDGPVQNLHSLHLHVVNGNARETGVQQEESKGVDANQLGTELMRVTQELRAISADLHPPTLEQFGLITALHAHADRLKERKRDLSIELDLIEGWS